MAELTREQIRQIGITSEKVMSLYEECKCPGDATLCFSDRVLNAMLEISARCLSAPAPQQSSPVETINAAPQAGESQSFPQGCSVSDPRTDSNDKSRPVVAAPEQQELIARLLEVEHDAGCEMSIARGYAFARVCDCTLPVRKQAAEALSRSHEGGRRAGLEEAAKSVEEQPLTYAGPDPSGVRQLRFLIVEHIRALKTPKGTS